MLDIHTGLRQAIDILVSLCEHKKFRLGKFLNWISIGFQKLFKVVSGFILGCVVNKSLNINKILFIAKSCQILLMSNIEISFQKVPRTSGKFKSRA